MSTESVLLIRRALVKELSEWLGDIGYRVSANAGMGIFAVFDSPFKELPDVILYVHKNPLYLRVSPSAYGIIRIYLKQNAKGYIRQIWRTYADATENVVLSGDIHHFLNSLFFQNQKAALRMATQRSKLEKKEVKDMDKESQKKRSEALKEAAKPLIEYVNKHCCPHDIIIVQQGSVELFNGEMVHIFDVPN